MTGDYLFFDALAKEIAATICGGKINRVSMPDNNEIVLGVYAKGEVYNLYLNARPDCPHFRISKDKLTLPESCPSFCMFMRKHLIGGEITSIETIHNDRILKVYITARDDMHYSVSYSLLFEIMSRNSNIIILDNDDIVREALKKGDLSQNSPRALLAGLHYVPPSNKRLFCGDSEQLAKELSLQTTIFEMLNYLMTSVAGIGKAGISFIGEQLSSHYHELYSQITSVENKIALSDDEKNNIIEDILSSIDKLRNPKKYNLYNPCVLTKNASATSKKGTVLSAIQPDTLDVPNDNRIESKESIYDCYHVKVENSRDTTDGSLNTAMNLYYYSKLQSKVLDGQKKHLLTAVKKLHHKLSSKADYCYAAIKDAEGADYYKKLGETIINNIYLIPVGAQKADLMDYESGESISVPFDKQLSASQNAKRYFSKYNKLKRSKDINATRLIDILADKEKLGSILYELEAADDTELVADIKTELIDMQIIKEVKAKSKSKKIKPYDIQRIKKYSIDGLTLLVGRNNIQNNELTFSIAKAADVWLHVKGYHGSHCLLITDGKAVPEAIIEIAAQICAYHSEAKYSSKCEVDYTQKSNVKRHTSKVLGLVNYVNYKTISVSPLEHADLS